MDFELSPKTQALQQQLGAFMEEHIYPNDAAYWEQLAASPDRWQPQPIVEALKPKARAAGLWNLFHHSSEHQLTNLEYAPLCEMMGRVHWASEVFNCSAPDTGNMETLGLYGTDEQKRRWLEPLMEGKIRSTFSMTEPDVASSDATNISTQIRREGDEYVINGRKWFSSGAGAAACKLLIVMGKTDPDNPDKHRQQSMILVPRDTPGIQFVRNLQIFGYDDAPFGHAELVFDNVRVPVGNILLGEGRAFEIAQGRLGPGRIHHCMRLIGFAEVALEAMCKRSLTRFPFGKALSEQTVTQERVANARILIDQARLLVMHAAWKMDKVGNKAARREIAMIKVAAPNMACQVIDWAMQAHGGGGLTQAFGLAYTYARARTTRFADGPDEVHRNQIAKMEFARYQPKKPRPPEAR
ncbi:MAG TPA: acyl-CoA dehydrogenase family protein [Ramlibacter sp.]|nr:acyl-CoA dehydrogenase family protein [Ramlibacter sp.]